MALKKGDRGVAVANAQKNLNFLGAEPKLVEDGIFGPKTDSAVKTFQAEKKLVIDGIIGPKTDKAISKAMISLAVDMSKPPEEKPVEQIEAPWQEWERKYLGKTEFDKEFVDLMNPYWANSGLPKYKGLEGSSRAWCAMFLNAALKESGYKGTKDASAISFSKYGTKCDLIPGCIVVMQHPNGSHHVTTLDHIVDAKKFAGLGGNQSNSVNVAIYDRSEIIATRWPVK